MEFLLVCLFVYVWAVIVFRESEEHEPINLNPDVKPGTPLPDADSTNPGHTTVIPDGTRYDSVVSLRPTARRNPLKRNVTLPSIPENQDGEDYAAEVEKLSSELEKTKSELQQSRQTALSLQQPAADQFETELISVRKSLSEETASNEQLRCQLSCLMAEKDQLSEQLVAATKKTVKPLTVNVACGCDVEVADTSTQTQSTKTKNVGCCGFEEPPTPSSIPSHPQLRNSEQQVTEDEDFGFELDFEMMERYKNRLRSFYIPNRERTKSSAVQAAPKPEAYFPVSDVRYLNKPISGYVVNSDGKKVTYGDAVKSTKKPSTEDLPSKKTEENVKKPAPDDSENTPRTTIDCSPVKTDELIVVSSPTDQKSLPGNKLLLTNIPGGDYGRIIGSGGSNINRIEMECHVAVSIKRSDESSYSIVITGNNEEMRQAAANEIVRGLTVVTECSNYQLLNRIKNFKLNEIGRKYFVRINRSFASDGSSGKMTLIGKLGSCQSAYADLLAELNVSQTKQTKGHK